ncbi:MAG: hypothetical protein GVY16_08870 [Planctomycetes bacterium]|nr:hypothetical protein [Phycisphaerae bacterium]NBB95840.1 hypothetical protein [Planctomycetota bacterium]
MTRQKNDPLTILGLLILLVCGVMALLRTYGRPEPTQAETAEADRHSAVDARGAALRPGHIYSGDLADMPTDRRPHQASDSTIRPAIDTFLGLTPGEVAIRQIGPYSAQQWQAIVTTWKDHMVGWQTLRINGLVLTRRDGGRIAWQADEGLAVVSANGLVFTCAGPCQWVRRNEYPPRREYGPVAFTLSRHTGRIWPAPSRMADLEPISHDHTTDHMPRIATGALRLDLAAFLGYGERPSLIMKLGGMDADRARQWIRHWHKEHPDCQRMRMAGIEVRRGRIGIGRVSSVEPIAVTTWDGNRYEIEPDGHWQWAQRSILRRRVKLKVSWLTADSDKPVATATDEFLPLTPWQILGLE